MLELALLLLVLTIVTGLVYFTFLIHKTILVLDKLRTPVINQPAISQDSPDSVTPDTESTVPLMDFQPDFKKPLKIKVEDEINEN